MKIGIFLTLLITLILTNCGKIGGDGFKSSNFPEPKNKKYVGPINNFVIPANSISEDELLSGLYMDEDGLCSPNIRRRQVLEYSYELERLGVKLFSANPYHGKDSSGLALPTACENSTLGDFFLIGSENTALKGNPFLKDYLITKSNSCYEYASVLWPLENVKLKDQEIYFVAEGKKAKENISFLDAGPYVGEVFCEEMIEGDQKVFKIPGMEENIVFVSSDSGEGEIYLHDPSEQTCNLLYAIEYIKDGNFIKPDTLIGMLKIKNFSRYLLIKTVFDEEVKTMMVPLLPHLGVLDFEEWSEEIISTKC